MATAEKIEISYYDDARNRYKVPKKQWYKWSTKQRALFNRVHSAMMKNQELFTHPFAPPVQKSHWKTIAWNAAWEAACGCE